MQRGEKQKDEKANEDEADIALSLGVGGFGVKKFRVSGKRKVSRKVVLGPVEGSSRVQGLGFRGLYGPRE